MTRLTFSQEARFGSSHFYFTCSADTLARHITNDINGLYRDYYKNNRKFDSVIFKEYFYNSKLFSLYKTIFDTCLEYLKDKLGNKFACQYINQFHNQVLVTKYKKEIQIDFNLVLPVFKNFLKNENKFLKNQNNDSVRVYYDSLTKIQYHLPKYIPINFLTTIISFNICIDSINKLAIDYPKNLNDCEKKENCDVSITFKNAIELLEHKKIIKNNDHLSFRTDGFFLIVSLTQDGWSFRNISIDLKTGETKVLGQTRRID